MIESFLSFWAERKWMGSGAMDRGRKHRMRRPVGRALGPVLGMIGLEQCLHFHNAHILVFSSL